MDKKRCKIEVRKHDKLGYAFYSNGECGDRIKNIADRLGPYNRKFFMQRLIEETSDASVNADPD